ncbi:GntR family transcriptional regulator [Virgibacillus sp. NKC19-3]|uniref:GntR family transcriptional regulator n=1 Tax=Virgibacillus saliphilus TaxID=2831674 RepID=UPI001C9BB81E|nr:GntR family transcriptional regulator [Virgibacillus sp. NKC19-3]MBY7142235.1 GntR family transcriptional regulator [Virgibacillus sp. NKC19-3]
MNPFKAKKGTPLYKQVYDWIKANIDSGHFEMGRQLPPEPTLSRDLGVSRSTLRQALQLLIDEGICYQQQGKGTFIHSKRSRYELTVLTSFTEQMMAKGKRPSSKLLEFTTNLVPDSYLQLKLGLTANDRIIKIVRLRFGDDVPMSLETVYIDEKLCVGLEKYDLSNKSMYHIIENDYNHPVLNGSISIEPDEITEKEATLLEVTSNKSILHMESINYTRNSRPLFITFARYPKDRYIFTVNMPRRR